MIVSGWNELGTLAAVILLRSLLTLLLHWEIDVEEKRQRECKEAEAGRGREAARSLSAVR